MLTNAAEQSIPKSTPGGAVKKYWRYDLGVKCAKQDYNRASRHYRRNRNDANKITMREKFDIFNGMCKHVQERSWRDWVKECNVDISSRELWHRLRTCTGVPSRTPTHPNPTDKAEELCLQFVNRSNIENLPIDTRQRLNVLQSEKDAIIHQAIKTKDITD